MDPNTGKVIVIVLVAVIALFLFVTIRSATR